MKRKTLYLAAASGVLALGLVITWFVYFKKRNEDPQETKKISVLFKGSLRGVEALQRILTKYAAQHQPLEFEVFHRTEDSAELSSVSFSLVMADLETLTDLTPKLRSFDASEVHEGLNTSPLLLKARNAIGIPLYEHRFMTLYYDKRKVQKAGTWVDLALALMPHTNRAQHQYGLAMGEDVHHALPFFSSLWEMNDSRSPALASSGYAELSLLRHALPVVPLDCAAPCADAIFLAGKAAMALADDARLDEFAKALGADHLGIMPLPSGKAPRQTQYLGFAKDSQASDHEASNAFVQYLYSPEGQKEIFHEFRAAPSLALQIEMGLGEPMASEILNYVRQSTVPVTASAHTAALARLEPSLKSFLNGQIGENEATLALSTSEEHKATHE